MDKQNIKAALDLQKSGPLSAFLEMFSGLSDTERLVVITVIEQNETQKPGRPKGSRNKPKTAVAA